MNTMKSEALCSYTNGLLWSLSWLWVCDDTPSLNLLHIYVYIFLLILVYTKYVGFIPDMLYQIIAIGRICAFQIGPTGIPRYGSPCPVCSPGSWSEIHKILIIRQHYVQQSQARNEITKYTMNNMVIGMTQSDGNHQPRWEYLLRRCLGPKFAWCEMRIPLIFRADNGWIDCCISWPS